MRIILYPLELWAPLIAAPSLYIFAPERSTHEEKKSSDLKWIEREREKKNLFFFSPEISGWNNEGIPWAILFSVRKHLREKERMREREASPLFFEPPPEIDQLNGSILDILASKHEYFFFHAFTDLFLF